MDDADHRLLGERLPLSKKKAQKVRYRAARVHPQGNGTIEAASKIIFYDIKKRLGEAKGMWTKELPWVLWAYRTTPRSSTRETPFRIAYGTDALLPIEVGLESHRTEIFDIESNEVGLRANIDLLEKEREAAY
ncbi:uncharacterized protein LOC141691945 [Apium graveolens]|uniref:uncharacterized protein LOC141691945 n=1 Tax=Apium graveolens TaxID=4045 RepID=UPI003D797641